MRSALDAWIAEDVGKRIAAVRRKRTPRLTQAKLAKLTEGTISRSALANIESGRQGTSSSQLAYLALALRTEPAALIPTLTEIAARVGSVAIEEIRSPDEVSFTAKILRDQPRLVGRLKARRKGAAKT